MAKVATVAVKLPGQLSAPNAHRRVLITGYNGRVPLELKGATSPEAELDGLAADWVEVDRPGRLPLLEHSRPRLRRIALEATLSTGDPAVGSIETDLLVLIGFAGGREPVLLTYAPLESSKYVTRSGRWNIGDMRVRSVRRRQGDNAISRARVSLELIEHSPAEPVAQVGPPPPATPAAAPSSSGTYLGLTPAQWKALSAAGFGVKQRRHTVARGETLWAIAARYYGDGNLWPKLADANGIRNPRTLAVGTVLTIP